MKRGILIIFSGLPGCGKTTLAKLLTQKFKATYLRIDTVEQALREVCGINEVEGMGYCLSHKIASENLLIGNIVIADSVNPLKLTRDEWNEVAIKSNASFLNIEIICSDKNIHQQRLKERVSDIKGLKNPTWEEVITRDYHSWDSERIQIDTASMNIQESLEELIKKIHTTCKLPLP